MARSNRGRSTAGDAAVPYCMSTPTKEAAKFLRLVAGRYINDRASMREVEEAIAMLRSEIASVADRAAVGLGLPICGAVTVPGPEAPDRDPWVCHRMSGHIGDHAPTRDLATPPLPQAYPKTSRERRTKKP